MRAYPSKSGGPDYLLVALESGQLLVLGTQLQLLWAASLDYPPVGMFVMAAGAPAVDGIVASLSDDGHVTLSYMGTDPPSQVVNTAKAALNYDNMDAEHRRSTPEPRTTNPEPRNLETRNPVAANGE